MAMTELGTQNNPLYPYQGLTFSLKNKEACIDDCCGEFVYFTVVEVDENRKVVDFVKACKVTLENYYEIAEKALKDGETIFSNLIDDLADAYQTLETGNFYVTDSIRSS